MDKKSILAGIDFSMTCPAICCHATEKDNDEFSFKNCQFFFLTSVKKYARPFNGDQIQGYHFDSSDFTIEIERYDEMTSILVDFLDDLGVMEIGLEGYAYGAKGRVFHIGECTGLLKYHLHSRGKVVSIYEPTVIKKFATSRGNATKEQMYEAFVKETGFNLKAQLHYEGVNVGSPVSDIVDAYYICKYLYHLGISPKISLAKA